MAKRFTRQHTRTDFSFMSPFCLRLDKNGQIVRFAFSNQARDSVVLNSTPEETVQLYEAYLTLGKMLREPANQIEHKMVPGDIWSPSTTVACCMGDRRLLSKGDKVGSFAASTWIGILCILSWECWRKSWTFRYRTKAYYIFLEVKHTWMALETWSRWTEKGNKLISIIYGIFR